MPPELAANYPFRRKSVHDAQRMSQEWSFPLTFAWYTTNSDLVHVPHIIAPCTSALFVCLPRGFAVVFRFRCHRIEPSFEKLHILSYCRSFCCWRRNLVSALLFSFSLKNCTPASFFEKAKYSAKRTERTSTAENTTIPCVVQQCFKQ